MTFDRLRAMRNLPLALAICFAIDLVDVAARGLPLVQVFALAQVGTNLAIAGALAGLSAITFKGRRQ